MPIGVVKCVTLYRCLILLPTYDGAHLLSLSIGGDEGDHRACATLPSTYETLGNYLYQLYYNLSIIILPDILRYFNSEVTGASFGTGGKDSDGAQLNRAVSAAKSE